MAFVINVTKWLPGRDYVFWCGGIRFLYLQHLPPQGLLLLRPRCVKTCCSTVTKSSSGSISWAAVLLSSHPVMCKTQMWPVPANTRCWPNAGPILAHRLRRWPSIKPALVQRLVFAGLRVLQCKPTPTQCLLNVGPASPVLPSIHSTVVSRPTSCWL